MARTVGLIIKKTPEKEAPKGRGKKVEEIKEETPVIEEKVEEEAPKGDESDAEVQE